VNTLCGKQVLEGKESDDAEHAHIEEGVRIKPVTVGEWEGTSPPRRQRVPILTSPGSK
jgi:cell division control protein 11